MTLKACLVAPDDDKTSSAEFILRAAEYVIDFSISYNYLLSVDVQTVWHMVDQVQPRRPNQG